MPLAYLDEQTNFSTIRKRQRFFVDPTEFLAAWWRSGDFVTVITRPRKFGKTLMLDAVRRFFSNEFDNQESVFSDLDVWKDKALRAEAGQHHVLQLSLRHLACNQLTRLRLAMSIAVGELYDKHRLFVRSSRVEAALRKRIAAFKFNLGVENDDVMAGALRDLCLAIHQHYGKKPVILIDGYDEPLWDARSAGCLADVEDYLRRFMACTLADNPALGRALLMGILPLSEDSIFSEVSGVRFCTATDPVYPTALGISTDQLLPSLFAQGFDLDVLCKARDWYGGYDFGKAELCNPWSVMKFVETKAYARHWSKTSKNELAEELMRTGSCDVKAHFLDLLQDDAIAVAVPERLSLRDSDGASVWPLLVATGYLTPVFDGGKKTQGVRIPNIEVRKELDSLIDRWFSKKQAFRVFTDALFKNEAVAMGEALTALAGEGFEQFEAADGDWENGFYGLALALSAKLRVRYVVRSTREVDVGSFDVILLPLKPKRDAFYLLKFTWKQPDETLTASAQAALKALLLDGYKEDFTRYGMDVKFIHYFGVAFDGKTVCVAQQDGVEAAA